MGFEIGYTSPGAWRLERSRRCCRRPNVSVDPVREDDVARARSPLKIVESLALGVPVVTGDVGDRHEVLGPAGRTTVPGDACALARVLQDLLGDREALQAAARAAPERAGNYRWSRLAEVWLEAYA